MVNVEDVGRSNLPGTILTSPGSKIFADSDGAKKKVDGLPWSEKPSEYDSDGESPILTDQHLE